MKDLHLKINELLKSARNYSMDRFIGENNCYTFVIGDRFFVIDKCQATGTYSFQENLKGYESNYEYIGALLYATKQPARIIKRVSDIINDPTLQIKGAKMV